MNGDDKYAGLMRVVSWAGVFGVLILLFVTLSTGLRPPM